jgi:hypothetical protein
LKFSTNLKYPKGQHLSLLPSSGDSSDPFQNIARYFGLLTDIKNFFNFSMEFLPQIERKLSESIPIVTVGKELQR